MQIETTRNLYVFISCPGDVEDEKRIVETVCTQLTRTLLPLEGIEIIPIRWPNDVISQITGEGAQTVINEQIGRYDYDIYIGIMWKSFGEKKANGLTPTQEEFEIALNNYRKNKKPFIQFYFKHDEQPDAEVQQFKNYIEDLDLGIYSVFKDRKEFEESIQKSLIYIVKNFDSLTAPESNVPKKKYPEVKSYLPRKVCSAEDYISGHQFYLRDKFAKDTLDIISDCKRIALLGDAGVGKTIELKRIACHFSKNESEFNPFFIGLNKCVNQSITDLLPPKWEEVPESKVIVILDGLDEIESKNKKDAIRQIELFAEKYPKTHILVSCRTNFYDSETKQLSGTLNGFSSYVLLDLDQEGIEKHINNTLQQRAKDFHTAISSNRLYELLKIPFYLTRLVGLFEKNNALPSHKAEIFEQLLLDRIQLDVDHFRTTKELKGKQQTIIKTLQKLALAMEVLGRNYISNDEYHQLIGDESLQELVEYCTVWKKDETETTKWQFEHNNFQEYLAAKLLSNKPLSTIKEFMFFEPDHRKLIPSWSNTLSFLISISNNHELIQWIIDNEPELAVKFEPDKIEIDTRIKIFKEIFKHYKEKQIWINHDKFRYDELARFGQSDEIVEFVLCEAEKSEHYTTSSNAIELLSYLQIPHNQRERVCNLLVNYALGNNFGDHVQSRALMALANLYLNSFEIIEKITKDIQTSDSEWIRYGLYYFLHNSEYLDDNIDIFLNGLKYIKLDLSSERGKLFDEHWHLRIGLEKTRSPAALEKILKYFIEYPQDISDVIFEESISLIAQSAADACSKDPSLFHIAKSLFEVLTNENLYKQAHQFKIFFDKTKTRLQVFREYLSQENNKKDRWDILAILADKDCIKLFVKEYQEGRLKDDNVLTFRNYLAWQNSDLYSPFNDQINAKTNNRFCLPTQRDYSKERMERTQSDINLLFDKQAFLNEIKLIFDTENKKSLTDREIMDIQHINWDNPYFSNFAIDQLRNLAKQESMTIDNVEKTVNTWNWDWFCVCNVYEKLAHNDNIVLTDEQKFFIANWCYSNLNKVSFKTALVTKPNRESGTSWVAVFLWYFLRKFNLTYPKEVLLDLLSYDWIEGSQYVGIEYLEALLSQQEITTRILKNLEEGIANDDVLKNHFNYCKKHNLTEVLPYTMHEITKEIRGEDVRSFAFETICELSINYIYNLEYLLPKIKDNFKWNIIEKLIQNNSQTCHEYLLSLLQTANEEDKLKSAQYLIELQDLEGLKYYVDWTKKYKQSPKTVRYDKSPLLSLRILESVPYLVDLLKVSYQPSFKKTAFDYFEHIILNALVSIALQSDKNYQSVRKTVEDFINESIGQIQNVNFLNIFIEKLDQKYYASKSEGLNIKDAIDKLNKL